jgi:hypothetical protein
MTVDKVPCWGLDCDVMFEPWTNEWFCSDKCRAAYDPERAADRIAEAMVEGLVEEAIREGNGETR